MAEMTIKASFSTGHFLSLTTLRTIANQIPDTVVLDVYRAKHMCFFSAQ
jgi:hypothetical protein